jgi:hypothetical protein
VETQWYAVGQAHRCDRASVKVACVKDDQLGGVARLIGNKADRPPLILPHIRMCWHKDKLARMAASTEVVKLPNAPWDDEYRTGSEWPDLPEAPHHRSAPEH